MQLRQCRDQRWQIVDRIDLREDRSKRLQTGAIDRSAIHTCDVKTADALRIAGSGLFFCGCFEYLVRDIAIVLGEHVERPKLATARRKRMLCDPSARRKLAKVPASRAGSIQIR